MLDADLSVKRLMTPQPSPVDCQMMIDPQESWRYRCRRKATHVVVVDAGCWRAVCIEHAVKQANLHQPGKSFPIEYTEPDPCEHIMVHAVPSTEERFEHEYECDACGAHL